MRQVIGVFLIGVGCWVSSGCVGTMLHGYPHPHSELTAPTFCLYKGWEDEHAQPFPIYEICVTREETFSDDTRFEWDNWLSWRKGRYADQVTWEIKYVPDDNDPALTKPLSCITYGKAPPGYDELIPPLSLIPERLYTVQILPKGITPMSWVYFIIRADSQGHPTQLEVRYEYDIHIINQE